MHICDPDHELSFRTEDELYSSVIMDDIKKQGFGFCKSRKWFHTILVLQDPQHFIYKTARKVKNVALTS